MTFKQGIDIVENKRIERIYAKYKNVFLSKILTENEINDLKKICSKSVVIRKITSRFSAKEAAAKAIGTGFREGLKFTDIEIKYDNLEKPELKLKKKVFNRIFNKNQKILSSVSISNEKTHTIAIVTFISL
tara:strand:+ start:5384 stop:5776 length:393 start_codon:yes stop_codon:yes gene_type:complete